MRIKYKHLHIHKQPRLWAKHILFRADIKAAKRSTAAIRLDTTLDVKIILSLASCEIRQQCYKDIWLSEDGDTQFDFVNNCSEIVM